MSCCCGPPDAVSFDRLVPADKSLSPEWLRSLRERGSPEIYRGEELRHIGMPVGGICAGQVYVGGDGRLWHWDVFKGCGGADEHADPRGYHYAAPMPVKSPLDQGFALRIGTGEEQQTRRLDATGFSGIGFEGRYPIARVGYSDTDCPVEVRLEAFSPFVPLDEENSSLPVTVMQFVVTNRSATSVSVQIAGWLENKICRYDDEPGKGSRRNQVVRRADALMLCCHADTLPRGGDPSLLDGYGNMTLALLDSADTDRACAFVDNLSAGDIPIEQAVFEHLEKDGTGAAETRPFGTRTVGALGRGMVLRRGQSRTARFAVAWYFPAYNRGHVFHSSMEDLPDLERLRRHYAKRFGSSEEVAGYLADNFAELAHNTRLWVETWYDSTLPHWFLNRTFLNASTLATQTCHWFDTGRFYAWEGVDCCPGTCQHVWQYAQAVSRLFPRLERWVREHVDYGIAFRPDGSLNYRAEASRRESGMEARRDAEAFFAADGQCGTILRVWREHTLSADAGFLSRIWPKVRKSIEFLATLDGDGDGLLDGPQYHTLDTTWHGQIPWISSLYLASLAAGKRMAEDMGDAAFADVCGARLEAGRRNFVPKLFNGEYFVHRPDPSRPDSMDLTGGCHIDQVFGQGYAMQLGLERVIPEAESRSALRSLWRYNYAPDVGRYRRGFKDIEGGRWFALPGESGLLICCWPRDDCGRAGLKQHVLGLDVTSEGYFNECMSGFEYQVASHMIAEGLVREGLAVTRSVHDRYHPTKRNPWNEVECSDHYSRAMASYGVFLSACGFHYHGPGGYLSFAPKLTPEDFRCAFTAAEGWGTFAQTIGEASLTAELHLKLGWLDLSVLALAAPPMIARLAHVRPNGPGIPCVCARAEDGRLEIGLAERIHLAAGDTLRVTIDDGGTTVSRDRVGAESPPETAR